MGSFLFLGASRRTPALPIAVAPPIRTPDIILAIAGLSAYRQPGEALKRSPHPTTNCRTTRNCVIIGPTGSRSVIAGIEHFFGFFPTLPLPVCLHTFI